MADITNLSKFLTDVADAIRSKKGDDNLIPAANFDDEILNLPTSGGSSNPEGVKLFNTVEEMQADTTAKEGDLAVVYANENIPLDVETLFAALIFPEIVVLDSAMTSGWGYSGTLYAQATSSFQFFIDPSSVAILMSGDTTDGVTATVRYTSPDGITYTRDSDSPEKISMGGQAGIIWSGVVNINVVNKFILATQVFFGGIYSYKETSYVLAETQLNTTKEDVYNTTFYGKNGVEQGRLGKTMTSYLGDRANQLYANFLNVYDTMESVVVEDYSRPFSQETYAIPILTNGKPFLDTSNMTIMDRTFYDCINLKKIPLLDTKNVTSMLATFQSCTNLEEVALLDTSNVTTMANMFSTCVKLTTVPQFNTSNVTIMKGMFLLCEMLQSVPLFDTSKVEDVSQMFQACYMLREVPLFDLSNVTNMSWMCQGCSSLTMLPEFDTSNAVDLNNAFAWCSNVQSVPVFNISNATNIQSMFEGCSSLSNDSLNNILATCISATSYAGTKTLQHIGLSQDQATRCQSLSNYAAFTSAGWTTGY